MKHVSLNLNVRGLKKSATLAINEKCSELQAQGKKIHRFGLGQSPFPVPAPVVKALQDNAHQKDYLPVTGLPALREAVAQFHRTRDLVNIEASNVLIGPGSKELMFLLQLAYYGNILVPSPCWVSYAPQAKILGRHLQFIQTQVKNKWRISATELEKVCRQDPYQPRILILNYPANPHGESYNEKDLRDLAQVARKYEIMILSDEIYALLHFKGQHISIARFYPERTIISSGLSKWCGAGGWRLGTFAFPQELVWLGKAMAVVASETYTSVSAPTQYAAIPAYQGGEEIENYLFHSRRILAALGNYCCRVLEETGVILSYPEGAFYLFLDFSNFKTLLQAKNISTSGELCNKLLEEKGVAILPGQDFSRLPEELSARLAYVDFDGEKALQKSRELGPDEEISEEFLFQNCQSVVEGVHKISDWLRNLA